MTLSGKARIAGVIGWPVAHSLSPVLHGWWLNDYGIDGAYVPFAVPPEDLETVLRTLPKLGMAGCNLTLPHKEAALRLADSVTPEARRIGAVNTIVVEPDGTLSGSNTDGFGFLECLRAALPDWRADAGPAVVLGAGGAARAVVVALLDAGAPVVRLLNRTRQRADDLAAAVDGAIEVGDWSARAGALADAALLVNTTQLGMAGQDPLELDLTRLPTTAVVNDIVYVPLITPLLADARARGNRIVDGLGMLLHQARPGFAAWFGVEPDVTAEQHAHVLAQLDD